MPHRLPSETKGAVTPLLLLALKSANVGVIVKGSDGRCLYASGLPEYFPQLEAEKISDETLFEEDWLPQIRHAQQQVLESGERRVVELARSNNSQFYFCECSVQRYEGAAGTPAILITFVDLTLERKREETLKALLREVSHRSKNLLAIIQSIATQTAVTSDDLDSFVSSFLGRIAALSSAQDLVTDSNWRGAMLRELATRQFSRYVEMDDPRIVMSGPDVLLMPNGATHIGLALHELIANATGYGALSNGDGSIKIDCHRTGDDRIELVWDEETGCADRPHSNDANVRNSFGSTVLQRVVPAALDAEAEYLNTPEHVRYRLRFVP